MNRQYYLKKKVFSFDLDDTLHNYKNASSAANNAIINYFSAKSGIDTKLTQAAYQEVLSKCISSDFVDGRSSFEYRAERFDMLACKLGLYEYDIDYALNLFDSLLMKNAALFFSSDLLLKRLNSIGIKMIIISDAPFDAQLRILKKLGIYQYFDELITSNKFGLSKSHGLVKHAVFHILGNLLAEDFVHIGDNLEKDIAPCVSSGIDSIYLGRDKCEYKVPVFSGVTGLYDFLFD